MSESISALETEQALADQVGELLRQRGLTLAVAESCTGGGLGNAVTDIAGSSDYFLGGVIAYSYEAKEALLGVPHTLLEAQGAVNAEVAVAMAEGARRLLQADLAVGITGIAGPGGGTPTKPVGLVFIALASVEGSQWRQYVWKGNRVENKRASVRAALRQILAYLTGLHA